MMKKKRKWSVFLIMLVFLMQLAFLSGCTGENANETTKAYYVISEELDYKKTPDKR